jgi:hypothetical protein
MVSLVLTPSGNKRKRWNRRVTVRATRWMWEGGRTRRREY